MQTLNCSDMYNAFSFGVLKQKRKHLRPLRFPSNGRGRTSPMRRTTSPYQRWMLGFPPLVLGPSLMDPCPLPFPLFFSWNSNFSLEEAISFIPRVKSNSFFVHFSVQKERERNIWWKIPMMTIYSQNEANQLRDSSNKIVFTKIIMNESKKKKWKQEWLGL